MYTGLHNTEEPDNCTRDLVEANNSNNKSTLNIPQVSPCQNIRSENIVGVNTLGSDVVVQSEDIKTKKKSNNSLKITRKMNTSKEKVNNTVGSNEKCTNNTNTNNPNDFNSRSRNNNYNTDGASDSDMNINNTNTNITITTTNTSVSATTNNTNNTSTSISTLDAHLALSYAPVVVVALVHGLPNHLKQISQRFMSTNASVIQLSSVRENCQHCLIRVIVSRVYQNTVIDSFAITLASDNGNFDFDKLNSVAVISNSAEVMKQSLELRELEHQNWLNSLWCNMRTLYFGLRKYTYVLDPLKACAKFLSYKTISDKVPPCTTDSTSISNTSVNTSSTNTGSNAFTNININSTTTYVNTNEIPLGMEENGLPSGVPSGLPCGIIIQFRMQLSRHDFYQLKYILRNFYIRCFNINRYEDVCAEDNRTILRIIAWSIHMIPIIEHIMIFYKNIISSYVISNSGRKHIKIPLINSTTDVIIIHDVKHISNLTKDIQNHSLCRNITGGLNKFHKEFEKFLTIGVYAPLIEID